MYPIDCAKFIKAVTNSKTDVKEDDNRVTNLLNEYDKGKNGFIPLEGFVDYFMEATRNPQRRGTVWENLYTMGIRNDLKSLKDDFFEYDKNLNKNNLFRYEIAQNDNIFNLLMNEGINDDFLEYLCDNEIVLEKISNFTFDFDKAKVKEKFLK